MYCLLYVEDPHIIVRHIDCKTSPCCVWYVQTRHLLQPELVLEDVSQDHARKTVTIEDHPHMAGKHASVHPCRHGAVMKKIIDVLMSRGVNPEVDKYLFIFLKFVASVIPTIEYDYTMDFDLGHS
jgi:ubiquitin-like-conjugating enzyme ATG3